MPWLMQLTTVILKNARGSLTRETGLSTGVLHLATLPSLPQHGVGHLMRYPAY
jgi:hypothetical protein